MPRGDLVVRLRLVGARLLGLPRAVFAALSLAWIGMIWTLSEQPLERAPRGLLWGFLGNGVHVPLFGLLALWVALALPRRPGDRWPRLTGRAGFAVVLFVAANGVLDEWHQSFTGRSPSAGDVLTDVVAATWVVAVASYVGRSDASTPGARWRFWGGVAACLIAAAIATL